jgi:hypothetical protein
VHTFFVPLKILERRRGVAWMTRGGMMAKLPAPRQFLWVRWTKSKYLFFHFSIYFLLLQFTPNVQYAGQFIDTDSLCDPGGKTRGMVQLTVAMRTIPSTAFGDGTCLYSIL